MSRQKEFDRIVATLHEAMFDEDQWVAVSAMIDKACGRKGNHLMVVDQFGNDAEIIHGRLLYHGAHDQDLERKGVEYFWRDPRIPRMMGLPDAHAIHMPDLYTERELRTDPAYNEMLRFSEARDGLNIRMDGAGGLHIAFVLADPVKPGSWGSEHFEMLQSILPHIRQFIRVRHALVHAEAFGVSLTGLLDTTMIGIIQLDWRGRIIEANGRASEILRQRDGLMAAGLALRARRTTDDVKLGKQLARALPPQYGSPPVSSSLAVGRTASSGHFTLHICPLVGLRESYGVGRVAALVLIVDPVNKLHIDPDRTMEALGLTRAEGRVAAALAGGASVREIATATYRTESTVRWTIKRIHAKLGISRQADLVRIVLSTAGTPGLFHARGKTVTG